MYQTTAINGLSATNALAIDDISTDGISPVSIESRALQAYARSVMTTEHNKSDIMLRLEAPGLTSPEELQAIQEQVADYGINLSLISTISRKVTSAVETVLRA